MDVLESTEALRRRRADARRVAFVPTMGALHEGHLALMRQAAGLADEVFVSIFVNPTQFGPGEDLDRYPRTLEADLRACEAAGVHAVFVPSVQTMYPPGVPAVSITVPALAETLEGAYRPGFFAGVCRVVAKLFNLVQPDTAVFGEKDYQQLIVVTAMTADLCLPIRITPGPTVRDPDGLAMSSRNRRLSPEQRKRALSLSQALDEARDMVARRGEHSPRAVEDAMRLLVASHGLRVDYAAVRHPTTLGELDVIAPVGGRPPRALIAARIGEGEDEVRLIDNAPLPTVG